MTATAVPARPMQRAGRSAPLGLARLLRVELRRNAMPWVLPLIALVFWFDSYRIAATMPPLWAERLFYIFGQGHSLIDFAPFVAGVAAWMGSRDGRRGLADLLTTSVRPRFAVQFATWAATAIWAVGGYLVFMAATLWALGRPVWGAPPWWPVAVGAVGVAAFSAAGFALGAYFPSRFIAPVAAFGGLLACGTSSQIGFTEGTGWALILPTNSNNNFGQDAGVFYQFLPDLPIARVMFLAGVGVALVALLGLPATAGGRRLRRTAALVTAAGAGLAIAAVGLATTAQTTSYGVVIPALHDAANDQPIPYTSVCGNAGIQVCLQPAYRPWLADAIAALRPVQAQISGLPGSPARAAQVASLFYPNGPRMGPSKGVGQIATISGRPAVLYLPLGAMNLPGSFGQHRSDFADAIKLQSVHAFIVTGSGYGDPAQLAIEAALMKNAGIPLATQAKDVWRGSLWGFPGPHGGPPSQATYPAQIASTATRFAALPAAARHAWLASHLAALRAGQLTVAQLP